MNTGIISTRYATAFLQYVLQTGGGDRVCEQVRRLLSGTEHSPVVLEPELERFVLLLKKHGRLEDVRFVLSSFVSMYYHSKGEACVRLITAVPSSEDLKKRICRIFEDKLGCKVHCECEVDSSIVGGFQVIVDDDYILDASVQHQLDSIRRQFVKFNTRIV